MKQRNFKPVLTATRATAVVLLIALAGFFHFSFTTSRSMADDIWKQLGMSKEQGTDGVKQSFLNGYLNYYNARNARNIALNNRAALAKDLLTYTKQYINSPGFKKEYDQLRVSAKPTMDDLSNKTKEDVRKEKIAETEKSIRKTEEIMKNKDMAKVMQPTYEMLKKALVDYKDPNSKNIESYYQFELRENENKKKSYNERLAKWEKEYPSDHREKIKQRLNRFLELAATVDFDAELKQVGKMKKFVKQEYEGKPYDWKQIFRAGKEVIEPAQQFAEQWLKELSTAMAKN